MNARPLRRFLFALAGHLHKTVRELEETMDCRELAEWICYARFWRPLDDSWQQTGILANAILSPHMRRGATPAPERFIQIESAPQHKTQINDALERLKADLEATRCQRPSD